MCNLSWNDQWVKDDSSRTNSYLELRIINLQFGSGVLGVGVLAFWAWDEFCG